jgi:hypothetical protein
MVEKCMVIDDRASYTGRNLPAVSSFTTHWSSSFFMYMDGCQAGHRNCSSVLPMLHYSHISAMNALRTSLWSTLSASQMNIGFTYFRSSPGVTRCVHSWLYDMWREVVTRPLIWDQDVFRKVCGS